MKANSVDGRQLDRAQDYPSSAKNVCATLEEGEYGTVLIGCFVDLVSALRVRSPTCLQRPARQARRGRNRQNCSEFVGMPFVRSPSSVCRRAWDKSPLGSEMAAYRAITGDEPTASWPEASASRAQAFEHGRCDGV